MVISFNLFSAWKILRIPRLIYSILAGMGAVVGVFFDSFVRKYISNKLAQSLRPQRITLAVKLLHGMLEARFYLTAGSD